MINAVGFEFLNGAAGGSPSGQFKIYLENTTDATNLKSTTWTTAIGSMTNVLDGTYNIPVTPNETSTDLVLDQGFAYNGGGLYVAFEYIGSTFATTAATYKCNTDIAGGVKMIETTNNTPGATLTGSSSFRPQVRLSFPNPNTNELEVLGVFPDLWKSQQSCSKPRLR